MALTKNRKNFWEKMFAYPSFNIRFGFTFGIVFLVFSGLTYFLLRQPSLSSVSNQIATLNLVIQAATLVLGIFAAYYALRQLVETRFIGLEQAGAEELQRSHYARAFEKWRDAFYIKPEASVFTNMCEALLLDGAYDTFDQYMRLSKHSGFFNSKEIFREESDHVLLLYLKSVRHLLVKNQGEAEKHIADLVSFVKENGLPVLNWDFGDLVTSISFQKLEGECKQITENLISYLSKGMTPTRKADFESGNFASQVNEPAAEPIPAASASESLTS